jgi:hypothetical protein
MRSPTGSMRSSRFDLRTARKCEEATVGMTRSFPRKRCVSAASYAQDSGAMPFEGGEGFVCDCGICDQGVNFIGWADEGGADFAQLA